MVGGSFGLIPLGSTESSIVLEDPFNCPNASSLRGLTTVTGAGLSTPWGGFGCAEINVGKASGRGCGRQTGFDFGFDGYIGYGFPGQTREECCNATGTDN
jgi:hypothetical protein